MVFWQIVLAFVVLDILISLAGHNRKRDRERMERIERKLDLLLLHNDLQFEWPPRGASPVEVLVAEGKKIEAIKVYRLDNPGVGLKEAKDVIDGIARQQQGLAN